MNIRFGDWPREGTYYRPRPGVYAVIATGEGILATFQESPYPELQLPGGGIDPGEGALQALHREVYEETGYRIHSPRRLGMFHRYTYMPEYEIWAQKQCHIYLAALGRRVSEPTEPAHLPVFLPWATAASTLGISGDRHFLAKARLMLAV